MTDGEIVSTSSFTTEGAGATEDSHTIENVLSTITSTSTSSTRVTMGNNIRLPPFSTKHPAAWFQRAEVHFRAQNVKDETQMADLVMMMLPEDAFSKISPWIKKKSGIVSYGDLKCKLTEIFTLSIPARAKRALDLATTPLGDTKPSEAWDELVGLLMLDDPDENGHQQEICLSREIFLRRLPQNIRAQIRDSEGQTMEDLVRLADELQIAAKASRWAATAAINAVQEEEEEEPDVNAVFSRKKQHRPKQQRPPYQQQQFPQTQHHHQQPPQQQFRRLAANFSQPQQGGPEAPEWCFYHLSFGSRAKKCREPCSFPKN